MADYCLLQEPIVEVEIPEDILTHILKRLSAQDLSRFRCVCKDWRDLLRSSFFVDTHLNHHQSNKVEDQNQEDYMIMFTKTCSYSAASFHYGPEMFQMDTPAGFPVFRSKLDVCGPCNGIICLVANLTPQYPSFRAPSYVDSSKGAVYLCNPTTWECQVLPPRPFGLNRGKYPNSRVNQVERVACGFGFDPRTNAYKVVSVMYYEHVLGVDSDSGSGSVSDEDVPKYNSDSDSASASETETETDHSDSDSASDSDSSFDYEDGYERHLYDYHFDAPGPRHNNNPILNERFERLKEGHHGIYQIEIFDVGSNSWREVEMVLPDIPDLAIKGTKESYAFSIKDLWGSGLLFNGFLHWRFDEYILGFDLSNEVLRNLGKLNYKGEETEDTAEQWRGWGKRLVVVDDSLAMAHTYYGIQDDRSKISIFVMEKYGDEESWVKRYSWESNHLLLKPLAAIPNHGMLFITHHDILVSFNLFGNDCREQPQNYCYSSELATVVVSERTLVSFRKSYHRSSIRGVFGEDLFEAKLAD